MARTNFSIKPLIHSAPHRCKHTRTQPQPHAHTHNRSQWAKAIIIVFDHHEPHPHRCRSFCRIILLSERSASLRLVLFISSQLKCRPLPHLPPPPLRCKFRLLSTFTQILFMFVLRPSHCPAFRPACRFVRCPSWLCPPKLVKK